MDTTRNEVKKKTLLRRLSMRMKKIITSSRPVGEAEPTASPQKISPDNNQLSVERISSDDHQKGDQGEVDAEVARDSSRIGSEMPRCSQEQSVFEICIPESTDGLGFTLKGGKPTRIGRVRRGGSADRAGLRGDDIVLKVQYCNTSQYSTSSVARLIRNAEESLTLTISRQSDVDSLSSMLSGSFLESPAKSPAKSPSESSYASPIKSQHCNATFVTSTRHTRVNRTTAALALSPIKEQLVELSEQYERNKPDCCSSNSGYTSSGYRSYRNNKSLGSCTSSQESVFSSELNLLSETDSGQCFSDDVSLTAISHDLGLDSLLDLEDDFIIAMRRGLEIFCKPLKRVGSPMDRQLHSMVFQNIEKLVAISEFHLIELSKCCRLKGDQLSIDHIADVYSERINETSAMYMRYELGLKSALRILCELRTGFDRTLADFLEQSANIVDLSSDVSTLERLLCRPILHINKIRQFMCNLSGASSCKQMFTHIINRLNLDVAQKSASKSMSSSHENQEDDIDVMPDSVSVVRRITPRIEFPSTVEPFLLDDGYRSMVYVGECMWRVVTCSRGSSSSSSSLSPSHAPRSSQATSSDHAQADYTPVCLLLFSDMLLVTSETSRGAGMLVRHAPLLINDVVETHLKNDRGFSLTTIDNDVDANGYLDLDYVMPVKCRHHFVPRCADETRRWTHLLTRLISGTGR